MFLNKEVGNYKNPEVKNLANRLLNTILYSRVNSTVKKYLGAFWRWKRWVTSYKLSPISS